MHFCAETANIWKFVGQFLLIFKIVIPLILIILGMLDLGKAVTSNDDKAVSKAAKSLLNRALAAVAIFFIPTVVGLVMDLVGGFQDIKSDYVWCKNCIVSPNNKCNTDCVDSNNVDDCVNSAASK